MMRISHLIPLMLVFTLYACVKYEDPRDFDSTNSQADGLQNVSEPIDPTQFLDTSDLAIVDSLQLDRQLIAALKQRPLFTFSPNELDHYIRFTYQRYPDLRTRIDHLAKKNFGQPYDIYLLGEFPFELTDQQPLFDLKQSDCVVYAEHVYAMALSSNWKQFFAMLQRIRYEEGVIGFTTRNHFTEADWIVNNSWLVKDITEELGDGMTQNVQSTIPKERFFKSRGIENPPSDENLNWSFIPANQVKGVLPQLKTGDFVNVVRGFNGTDPYVGHVGLISVDESDGTVYFIHSTEPEVRMQTLESYMEESLAKQGQKGFFDRWGKWFGTGNAPEFYGFKFLRLNEDAMSRLKQIDGQNAPKLTIYGNP